MPGPIEPMRPLPPLRPDRDASRDKDEGEDKTKSNLPMVIAQPDGEDAPEQAVGPKPAGPATAPFAAQMMGQGGIKRGLRGGKEVLDAARSSYLENEYSGPNDRRPPKGLLKKTEI
jgi:hypothetical protein